eukprot:TRINITY_DN12101_c0_g3_i1.p1 TRINITY_DN12101_c0_g3~~TRINITY_DN12101_c0_g3_i1.p1  ORF type:complete len:276 (-),score=42.03 TRINITY_DN12101_c0_g3_i1:293-1120(-)
MDKEGHRVVRDLSAIDTTDTLESFEDIDLTVESTNTLSDVALPEDVLNAAKALQEVLSKMEQATQQFEVQICRASPHDSPALDAFASRIKGLKSQLAERVVPELARELIPTVETGAESSRGDVQTKADDTEEASLEGINSCKNRSASVASDGATSAPSSVTVMRYCDSLVGPLGEVLKHANQEYLHRTLAVWDINTLGCDPLGALKRHFGKYGKVELATQPRISSAIGFALVRMGEGAPIKAIMERGEELLIGRVKLTLRPLDELATSLRSERDV